MKKTYGNIKTVLIALLSLVLVFGVAFASVATAEPVTEPQNDVITVGGDDYSLTLSVDAQRLGEITRNEIGGLRDKIVSQLKDIIINQLLPESTEPAHIIHRLGAPVEPGDEDIQSVLGRYKEKLEERLREPGELEKYLNGDYDLVIKQAVAEYMDNHPDVEPSKIEEVVDEVNEVVQDVIVEEAVKEQYPELADSPELLEEKKQEVKEQIANGDTSGLGDTYGEMYTQNGNKTETLTETVKDIVENGAPALEIGDIVAALRNITVGENVIFTEEGRWEANGVKGLISDLFGKIKSADSEFVIEYNVELELSFGKTHFDVRFELVNYDGSEVQRVIGYAKDHVDFGKIDGVWTLNVRIPESVNMLTLFNYFSESSQRDLFEMSDMTVSKAVEFVKGYTPEQMLDILKGFDYQGAFGALLNRNIPGKDFVLNKLFNAVRKVASKNSAAEVEEVLKDYGLKGIPAKLEGAVQIVLDELHTLDAANWTRSDFESYLRTNANESFGRILTELGQRERFDAVYERLLHYVQEVAEYIPEALQDVTLADIVSNGNLSWTGNVDLVGIDYDPLLTRAFRKIVSFLGGTDYTTVDSIVTWIDNNIKYENVAVSVNATVGGLSNVSYKFNGKTIRGILPDGADVDIFAPASSGKDGKDIVAWLNNDNERVTTVNGDVTLHAVTTFEANVSFDGEGFDNENKKSYDQKGFTLTAYADKGEGNDNYSYQWYKASLSDPDSFEKLDETDQSLSRLGNVADSGVYYCEITSGTYAENRSETQKIIVTIDKAVVTHENAWDYNNEPFKYTGEAFTVKLKSDIEADLNDKFTANGWEYTGNTATDIGKYTASVRLVANTENYQLNIDPLNWEIVKADEDEPDKPPVKPGVPGTKFDVLGPDGKPLTVDGTSIVVTDVNGVVPTTETLVAAKSDRTVDYFKDFLKSDGKNENASLLQVLDIHFGKEYEGEFVIELTNTDKFGSLTAENLIVYHIHGTTTQLVSNATVENGKITVKVNNFSDFAILSNTPADVAPADEPNYWWIWVLLAIIIILNIVIILLLLLRRKDNESSDTEEPAQDETVATDAEEEQPQEEVVPEATDDDDIALVVAGADQRTVLDRSFYARLSQADDKVKELYSDLKNDLLSYKKVRSRVSWKYDTFYKGRAKCVILQLRGKKINMYIALKAEDLAPKYHAKDVSDKARYETVPTLVKVAGGRSLLYAKQLVKLLMDNMGVERGVEHHENYKLRRRSTKSLMEDGLIKVKTVNGGFLSNDNEETAAPAEEAAATEAASDKPDNE